MRRIARNERGFTLMEVMVASSLLTLVVGSMFVLLGDYNKLLRQAQERNVFTSLRRSVIQNLNRRDAWIITYEFLPGNSSFQCLLNQDSPTAPPGCGTGDTEFTVFTARYPPSPDSVVFSNFRPPDYTAAITGKGFTINGSPCTTFNENAPNTNAAAVRCPIRLEVTWRLLTYGIPKDYYPTGYFPSGYYIDNPIYTPDTYVPGVYTPPSYDYWWAGTLGAQVEINGVFKVHKASIGNKVNLKNYNFRLIKQVPN